MNLLTKPVVGFVGKVPFGVVVVDTGGACWIWLEVECCRMTPSAGDNNVVVVGKEAGVAGVPVSGVAAGLVIATVEE